MPRGNSLGRAPSLGLSLALSLGLSLALSLGPAGCGPSGDLARIGGRNLAGVFDSPRKLPSKITRPVRDDARLSVLWVGHATVLVQIDDKIVLTDPVFTETVGRLSRRLVEPGLDPENLPPIDAVLISHLHFDHFSLGSLEMIEPKIRHLALPPGGLVYLPRFSFPSAELATWQSYQSGGLTITAVPVKHRGWRYGADQAWMDTAFSGYVIDYHGLRVYFGGDTAYAPELFRETKARFPGIDLALLPIAPIHPREFMSRTHVDPGEALDAFVDLGAERMIPVHFDTFINSLDEPGEAPALLARLARERGLASKVSILGIGEQQVVVGAARR